MNFKVQYFSGMTNLWEELSNHWTLSGAKRKIKKGLFSPKGFLKYRIIDCTIISFVVLEYEKRIIKRFQDL